MARERLIDIINDTNSDNDAVMMFLQSDHRLIAVLSDLADFYELNSDEYDESDPIYIYLMNMQLILHNTVDAIKDIQRIRRK